MTFIVFALLYKYYFISTLVIPFGGLKEEMRARGHASGMPARARDDN